MANDVSLGRLIGSLTTTLRPAAQQRLDAHYAAENAARAAKNTNQPLTGANIRQSLRADAFADVATIVSSTAKNNTLTSSLTGEKHEFGLDFNLSTRLFAVLFGEQSELLQQDFTEAQRNLEARQQEHDSQYTVHNIIQRLRYESSIEPPDYQARVDELIASIQARSSVVKDVEFHFPTVYDTPKETAAIGTEFADYLKNYDNINLYQRGISLTSDTTVDIHESSLVSAADNEPDFFIVQLQNQLNDPDGNQQTPTGRLVLDNTTLDIWDQNELAVHTLTGDEFHRLQYVSVEEDATDNASTLTATPPYSDVLSFLQLTDSDGSGDLSANDTRSLFQQQIYATNPAPTEDLSGGTNTTEITLEASEDLVFNTTFLSSNELIGGKTLLAAFEDGDISITGHEYGNSDHTLTVDAEDSESDQLALKFASGIGGGEGIILTITSDSSFTLPKLFAVFGG